MTYTDQVGTVGSSAPLVNDLQLRVKLNGDVFVPHFNSYSDINNIEMIDISAPCAGCNYTIEVRAVSLSAVQPYALVASGVLTNAELNSTSVSTSINTDESIGPNTMRMIIVLGLICFILGLFVFYLHKCDVPPPAKRRQKTFEEEQHEQAEALRFYEEQHRMRIHPPGSGNDRGGGGGGGGGGGEAAQRREEGDRGGTTRRKSTKPRGKKKKALPSNREVEMAAQQQQQQQQSANI
jgi:hypothetical protein